MVRRHARAACGRALLLDGGEELVEAPGVEHVFQPRLARLVRSPCSMKTRTMASATAVASSGLQDDAGVAREILVAGDAAEREPNQMPGLDADALGHLHGLKAMSLVSSSAGTTPPPSKATLNLRGRP